MKKLSRFGPGFLVTAAFIGPGTVTTASVAGARFGFALGWALVFSVLATIVLQEMSARLGLAARTGLGEALRTTFPPPLPRIFATLLVFAAVTIGCAAYEMGNLMGGAIGLEMLTGLHQRICALIVGLVAFLLLARGAYALLERVLTVLVAIMGVVFVVTAVIVRPDVGALTSGLLRPAIPEGSLLTIVALIGTTVVPYNLFLHASSVQEKWSASAPLTQTLRRSRWDTLVSILLGGVITGAVMTTAAVFYQRETGITSAAAMAEQLQPLLGPAAKYFFAAGLAAAGLTSAITAPMAAAYATAGVLGWPKGLQSWRSRGVWGAIVLIGTVFALTGIKPVQAIIFAQAANGLLLPIIAVFLLIVVNRRDLLGEYRNGVAANLLGALVVLVAAGLGGYQLLRVFGAIASG